MEAFHHGLEALGFVDMLDIMILPLRVVASTRKGDELATISTKTKLESQC